MLLSKLTRLSNNPACVVALIPDALWFPGFFVWGLGDQLYPYQIYLTTYYLILTTKIGVDCGPCFMLILHRP